MPGKDVGQSEGRSTDMLLGELVAEVRAIKHNQKNDSAKIDAVGRQTEPIKTLVEQVREIKEEQDRQHFRIAVLEADKNRREGAVGLVEWVAKHWPFSIIIAGLAAWVAWANGRLG